MSKTAIQLAGNTSSIFQAWLDLKRQTASNTSSLTGNRSGSSTISKGKDR